MVYAEIVQVRSFHSLVRCMIVKFRVGPTKEAMLSLALSTGEPNLLLPSASVVARQTVQLHV